MQRGSWWGIDMVMTAEMFEEGRNDVVTMHGTGHIGCLDV